MQRLRTGLSHSPCSSSSGRLAVNWAVSATASSWQALIDSGKFSNVHELARTIGKDDGYISRIIRLTLLSPEIIHAIIAGTLEKDIGIEQLKQAMPLMWDDQKKMFGME